MDNIILDPSLPPLAPSLFLTHFSFRDLTANPPQKQNPVKERVAISRGLSVGDRALFEKPDRNRFPRPFVWSECDYGVLDDIPEPDCWGALTARPSA